MQVKKREGARGRLNVHLKDHKKISFQINFSNTTKEIKNQMTIKIG